MRMLTPTQEDSHWPVLWYEAPIAFPLFSYLGYRIHSLNWWSLPFLGVMILLYVLGRMDWDPALWGRKVKWNDAEEKMEGYVP